MKIKMRIGVTGRFHSVYEDVKRGDIVDIDDENAERYVKLGYAQYDLKAEPETP